MPAGQRREGFSVWRTVPTAKSQITKNKSQKTNNKQITNIFWF
jgi:hypothetical protein